MSNVVIDTVAAYVDFVVKWRINERSPTAFRGQKYDRWGAVPKLFRPEIGMESYERESVRDIVAVHPQEFSEDVTMFDRLVRMQHFDLPTRLLDTTANPLVALYFASQDHKVRNKKTQKVEEKDGKVFAYFVPDSRTAYYDSDKVSCISALSSLAPEEKCEVFENLDRPVADFNKLPSMVMLLHYVGMEKPHFKAVVDPDHFKRPYYVRPKMSNKRIIAQSGSFIIFAQPKPSPMPKGTGIAFRTVIIPAQHKEQIRKELELLGIQDAAMFPEIDKAANFIVSRYRSKSAARHLSDIYGENSP